MNLDQYLNSLSSSENYDTTHNYDTTQNYLSADEHYEAVEIEHYLHNGRKMEAHKARRVAERIVKNPSAKAEIKNEMRRAGIASGFSNPALPVNPASLSAQVNLQIKRLTATVAADLPVPIFGGFDVADKYSQVLSLPSGVTISAFDLAKLGGGEQILEISYTDGTHTDKVQVSLQEYAYPAFLSACATTKFTVSNARYTISDTTSTGVQQLTQKFQSQTRSMFGKVITDNIPLSASKSPFQQQNGIVDILAQLAINPEVTWVLNMQQLAGQQVTIGMFISAVDKGIIG